MTTGDGSRRTVSHQRKEARLFLEWGGGTVGQDRAPYPGVLTLCFRFFRAPPGVRRRHPARRQKQEALSENGLAPGQGPGCRCNEKPPSCGDWGG